MHVRDEVVEQHVLGFATNELLDHARIRRGHLEDFSICSETMSSGLSSARFGGTTRPVISCVSAILIFSGWATAIPSGYRANASRSSAVAALRIALTSSG